MTPAIVICTIIGYFCLLLLISYFASRKSDNATFFTGDRKAPWALVSFAMIGAAISGLHSFQCPAWWLAKVTPTCRCALVLS